MTLEAVEPWMAEYGRRWERAADPSELFTGDGRCRELREAWSFEDGLYEPPSGWGA